MRCAVGVESSFRSTEVAYSFNAVPNLVPIVPHQSLEQLVHVLLAELAPHSAGPRPLSVVVPSLPFSDWLQFQIARKRGICMGLSFVMPQAFIASALAVAGAKKSEAWTKPQLTWQILPHIEKYAAELGVVNPSTRDRFALAETIADRFDQYGHFRPEMIEKWDTKAPALDSEAQRYETWQRQLWTSLQAKIQERHPAIELARLCDNEEFLQGLRAAFPKLLVMGSGVIDPLLAQMLGLLGKAGCDVRLHIVLPSMGYLGELRSLRQPAPDLHPEELPMHDGHPLLISMGRHAVGSFLLLGNTLDEQYTHWPDEPPEPEACPTTLLGQIQADIRELRTPTDNSRSFAHNSLQVHSCFGPRREMETLRDELLRAFREIPDLQPEQIHVITPSLETYAPLVAAILEQGATPLPVRLTELPPSEEAPLSEGLLALLEMARRGRFEASEIMELLHLRAVQDALGIVDQKLDESRARDWIKHSGLTHGLAADAAGEVGTWQFARDRLIAGRWFGTELQVQYPGAEFVLPVAPALSENAALLETFLRWHALLAKLLQDWQSETTPALWSVRLRTACDQLLSSDPETRIELQPLLHFLAELQCEVPVDCGTILDWLQQECVEGGARTLVSGKITFGRFKQLQNIPCRVLAIVGMEEGTFPRQNRVPDWDLLQFAPKAWDRNPRIDDRQLFLDALLTPSERLIITASTQNVRTGKAEPFSACVDELLRVARETGTPTTPLVVKHRLQPFASDYFQTAAPPESLPTSFDQQNGAIAAALALGEAREQCPLWKGADAATEPRTEISLRQLVSFWKDPAKAFLRAQGIALPGEDDNDQDLNRAPLHVAGLEAWAIKHAIFAETAFGESKLELTQALAGAERQLPPAVLGTHLWETLRTLSEALGIEVKRKAPIEIPLELGLGAYRLTGTLRTCGEQQTLLDYRVGKFGNPHHYLAPWIQAVAGACMELSLPTELLDEVTIEEGAAKELPIISREAAEPILAALIAGFIQGQSRPLCYAPATSQRYAKKFSENHDPDAALNAAGIEWNKQAFKNSPQGEGLEPAARAAWRDRDPFEFGAEWDYWASAIATPLAAWMS